MHAKKINCCTDLQNVADKTSYFLKETLFTLVECLEISDAFMKIVMLEYLHIDDVFLTSKKFLLAVL